jgi:hypothetical protein
LPEDPKRWIDALCVGGLIGLIATLASCTTTAPTTILIPPIVYLEDGTPTDVIMLGPDCKGYIFVKTDGKLVQSRNKISLPAGWLLAPPPPHLPKER